MHDLAVAVAKVPISDTALAREGVSGCTLFINLDTLFYLSFTRTVL